MTTDEDRYSSAVIHMVGAALRAAGRDDLINDAEILSIWEGTAARCKDPVLARNQIVIGLTYVVAGMVLHRAGDNLEEARRATAELGELILNGATK